MEEEFANVRAPSLSFPPSISPDLLMTEPNIPPKVSELCESNGMSSFSSYPLSSIRLPL